MPGGRESIGDLFSKPDGLVHLSRAAGLRFELDAWTLDGSPAGICGVSSNTPKLSILIEKSCISGAVIAVVAPSAVDTVSRDGAFKPIEEFS